MVISNELIYYILEDYYDSTIFERDNIIIKGYEFKEDWVEINFIDKTMGIKSCYLLAYDKYNKLRSEYFNKKINKIKQLWKQN